MTSFHSKTCQIGTVAVMAALFMLTGCSKLPTVPANALPPSLAAVPPRSPQTLDLSRLSSPTASSDVLQPGDHLELTVATGVTKANIHDHPVRLDEQGMAHLPLVGSVQLGGLKIPQAERVVQLESVRRGIFRQPQVALLVKKRKMHRITVAGAVEHPGVKEIPQASADLFTALTEAGKLADDADTHVEITYPMQMDAQGQMQPSTTVNIDLVRASAEGGDFPLPDGTAVMIRRQPDRSIHVDGLVRSPKRINLPFDKEYRLLDAVAEAGGRRLSLADKILVSRIDSSSGSTKVIEASFRQAQRNTRENVILKSGDVVSVQETPATIGIETIRSFIRVGFSTALPGF